MNPGLDVGRVTVLLPATAGRIVVLGGGLGGLVGPGLRGLLYDVAEVEHFDHLSILEDEEGDRPAVVVELWPLGVHAGERGDRDLHPAAPVRGVADDLAGMLVHLVEDAGGAVQAALEAVLPEARRGHEILLGVHAGGFGFGLERRLLLLVEGGIHHQVALARVGLDRDDLVHPLHDAKEGLQGAALGGAERGVQHHAHVLEDLAGLEGVAAAGVDEGVLGLAFLAVFLVSHRDDQCLIVFDLDLGAGLQCDRFHGSSCGVVELCVFKVPAVIVITTSLIKAKLSIFSL